MRTVEFKARLMIAACLALLVAGGCSRLNGTRLEPALGGDHNLVDLGDKVAGSLIGQTLPPLIPSNGLQPILVTTVVNNDNLDDTSSFGRSFQNNIAAGFVDRGFAVKEIKLRRAVLVEPHKGEFLLSRDLREIAERQRAQAVVVGTYAIANRVLYLSVRLVNPANQIIRSVYEDKLYLDENTLRMFGLQFKGSGGGMADVQVTPPSPSILDSILY